MKRAADRHGTQDRLGGESAFAVVSRAARELPLHSIVLTEDRFMTQAPAAFASIGQPVGNDPRYGDYFVARALAEVRRRFALEVLERGRFGFVFLELRRRL